MGKDFTVTVCDPERKAEFEAILGTATVCVKTPFPVRANLPGHPDALVYELDLELITLKQRERLVAHLAEKFELPPAEVEANLNDHGVPILADDCVVGIANPLRWT